MPDRWIYAARHGGWTTAIDATAALARLAWSLPPAERAGLVAGTRRDAIHALARHRSALVRINTAHLLAAVGDDDAIKQLLAQLHDDASPHARAAALVALARIHHARPTPAIEAALNAAMTDANAAVRRAAAAPPEVLDARDHWAAFYVVDPDDIAVRRTPYFVHLPDGLVWATETDARGEIAAEHVPAGDPATWPVRPATDEAQF